jgi:hypothetical protein
MNSHKHTHRAMQKHSKVVCFSGPVSDRQNPAAHGGICVVDVCKCGRERRTNINQRFVERGGWWRPLDE